MNLVDLYTTRILSLFYKIYDKEDESLNRWTISATAIEKMLEKDDESIREYLESIYGALLSRDTARMRSLITNTPNSGSILYAQQKKAEKAGILRKEWNQK